MGNDPNREAAACGHPALNTQDETQKAEAGDGYATRHNPFVYFHSVIDEQKYCNKHVVALGSPTGAMPAGGAARRDRPRNRSHHTGQNARVLVHHAQPLQRRARLPCTNQPSGASALADIDAFLETWVPKIMASQAYRENGLIEITFDEAANSETEPPAAERNPDRDRRFPGITGPRRRPSRRGAALAVHQTGHRDATDYNHYSSLASWESLLGLPRLAYAATVPGAVPAPMSSPARASMLFSRSGSFELMTIPVSDVDRAKASGTVSRTACGSTPRVDRRDRREALSSVS